MSRSWACAAALAVILLAPSPSRAAYQEVHASGHDVRVVVDAAGAAEIDESVSYRVVNGVLKGFDFDGLPVLADVSPDVMITSDDGASGASIAARIGPREIKKGKDGQEIEAPARPLRVEVLDPKGLKKGSYTFHLHYKEDLVALRAFRRDGALFRLAWTSPALNEGIDGMRVVLDLPAAPTEPELAHSANEPLVPATDDSSDASQGVIPTLRRTADRDVLEIVRPHVPRAEAVEWAARVDPRAFPRIVSPELRPPPPKVPPPPERSPWIARGAFGLLALLASLLAYAKLTRVDRDLRARGSSPRPLVALPIMVRASIYGGLVAWAVHVELGDTPTFGAALLALAMACVTHLTPVTRARARGPGVWTALKPSEALVSARSPRDLLDATTLPGGLALACLVGGLAVAAHLARRFDAGAPGIVFLDLLALAPLFLTGTRRQLPIERPRASAPLLRALYMRLLPSSVARVSSWGRVPKGRSRPDEVRLRVLPRAPMPGLLAVEVGVAFERTPAGAAPLPEVLVRVHEASPAAAKLTTLAPFAAPVTGRQKDERVVRLSPALPTGDALFDLVTRLTRDLVDRRLVVPGAPPWKGTERREGYAGGACERRALVVIATSA